MTGAESAGSVLSPEQAAVWAVVTDLYAAYLDNDRLRLESHLAAGCTMWDSSIPGLRTKEDLVAARVSVADSALPSDRKEPLSLEASEPVITVWGDTAMECHVLRAIFADASLNEHLRCTSIMRRVAGRWQFVHHHEERLQF